MILSLVLALNIVFPEPRPGIDAAQYIRARDQGLTSSDRKISLDQLEQAVKLYDQDGDVMYRYAQALLAAGKYDECIAAYAKAETLGAFNPKFKANVKYDLACAYAKQGKLDPAFGALKSAIDLGFRDLDHLRTDADLAALHGDPRWVDLAATADTSKMSRDEAWRYDLKFLNREVMRIHINPFQVTPKAEFERYVRNLDRDIPKLTDNQIMASFVKYMAMVGDGHTGVRPFSGALKTIPVQFYLFEEGLFVTAAAPEVKELAGAQILEIEGQSVDAVREKIAPYMQRDNAMGLKVAVARLTVPQFLNGIGVAPDPEQLKLKIKDSAGATREVTLKSQTGAVTEEWATARDKTSPMLYMKSQRLNYWYEYLPAEKLVYFQYNAVANQGDESIATFAGKMFKFIEENDVEALVVDCRWNGGGNSFLNKPLTHGILKSKVNKKGGLFVVIGRQTFSACQNFVTDLERECEAIYVGEPSGSRPNFVGESIRFSLPYSKMTGTISDLYWQRSWPMDNRMWIAPDLPTPPSFEMLRKNLDPAMEAIRAYRKG